MNKIALSLALGTSLVASLASAHAYDADPGYRRNAYSNQPITQRANARYQPMYYRPIQRYYGKGYTIAYNYVPVSRQTMRVTTDYEPQNLTIPANKIAAYGAKSPRISYVNPQTEAQLVGKSPVATKLSPTPSVPTAPTEPLPVTGQEKK